jgi:uncharacterized protein YacL
VIRSIRILGAALGGLIGIVVLMADSPAFRDVPGEAAVIVGWLVAWTVLGFSLLPYLTVIPAGRVVRNVQEMSTAEFVTAVLGLMVGLLMGLLLGVPLSAFPPPLGVYLPLGVSICLGLGMVGLTVAKRGDLLLAAEAIGLVRRPEAEDARHAGDPHILVDTSAIIDGRIGDIVESGFLLGTLVVPRFVLEEIQRIADSPDTLRRNRGRRGLEILNRMQKDAGTPVIVVDDDAPEIAEVDAKLVAVAKRFSHAVLTNDFNLNRVAELQGVRVLNINHLANAVKPALLPGEELRVHVIQAGKEAGQGVGFLDDGTMIVVEGGARLIDTVVDVAVTRVLQTVAGRMVFAQPRHD